MLGTFLVQVRNTKKSFSSCLNKTTHKFAAGILFKIRPWQSPDNKKLTPGVVEWQRHLVQISTKIF